MFLHNRLFSLLKGVYAEAGKYFFSDKLAVDFGSEFHVQAHHHCLSYLTIKVAGQGEIGGPGESFFPKVPEDITHDLAGIIRRAQFADRVYIQVVPIPAKKLFESVCVIITKAVNKLLIGSEIPAHRVYINR
jgi:hypothetical protein